MRTSLTDSSDGVSQYVKNVKTQRFQEDLQVSSGGSSQQAALLNSHELTICLALQPLQPSISPRAAIARPGSNKFPWVPWGAMGCHGVPWGAMGCHGVPRWLLRIEAKQLWSSSPMSLSKKSGFSKNSSKLIRTADHEEASKKSHLAPTIETLKQTVTLWLLVYVSAVLSWWWR